MMRTKKKNEVERKRQIENGEREREKYEGREGVRRGGKEGGGEEGSRTRKSVAHAGWRVMTLR